jgi:hypothetical protein
MTRNALLSAIQTSLQGFDANVLRRSSTDLLRALGYSSDKTFDISPNTFAGFFAEFGQHADTFNSKNAKADDWQSADILFQITDEDLSSAHTRFDSKALERDRYNSLLFMAIGLAGKGYTRTDLARITREVNKCFAMPVVILFRYGGALTIAVIQRRGHKRDASKDVLEKVTLVKDINTTRPHRAHLEILADLALAELAERKKHRIQNFETLFSAWQEALDTSELNKRFYRELSNWYFWALTHARFPKLPDQKDEERTPVALIRLITRLIFVWFIKEKGLVPEALFDKELVNRHLSDKHKIDSTTAHYYRAILQNLFFATLNTDMNRDAPGSRGFKGESKAGQRYHDEYMAHTRYRYRSYFRDPEAALTLFESIPFLNGGLFECLDKPAAESASGKEARIDGFSDDPRKQAELPDRLFFGEDDIDLNAIYGTKGKRPERVRGIVRIFERYKFTIDENTPIEEEVALDPELLGKVFENLLASYNPETRTTARKQTGSFYTPREIVNYMVDESLIAYLKTQLPASPPSPPLEKGGEALEDDTEAKLRQLFAYDDAPHGFSDEEVDRLIEAIDGLKILDPACGSGAFPMGILQRLVTILGKLDPNNERWKAQQLEREIAPVLRDIQTAQQISYDQAREQAVTQLNERLAEIQRAFEENDHDYARKLFLIENCLYGVDIQPIAVQIAKLRCFIALIVDQRVEDTKPNRGILALPNLETKFVAANTLIGIDKPQQGMFEDPELTAKQAALKKLRHEHFQARRWQDKKKLREQDKRLRKEIAELLKRDIFVTQDGTAEKLANWNPYDQNASADFFDAEWMFGVSGGFSIVIGNPPYVRQEQIKDLKPHLQGYACYTGTADLYVYFFEKGIRLLGEGGVLSYICSNKYFRAGYGAKLRAFLADKTTIHELIDFGDAPVFTAIAYPSIILAQKPAPKVGTSQVRALSWQAGDPLAQFGDIYREHSFRIPQTVLAKDGWRLERQDVQALLEKLRSVGTPLGEYVGGRFYRGVLTGFNEAFVVDRATRDRLIAEHKSSAEVLKPFLRGRDVKRWRVEYQDLWLIFTRRGIDIDEFPAIKKHLEQYKDRLTPGVPGGRKPGSYKWYEIQDNIAYWQEFEQPKIIIPSIVQAVEYSVDFEGYYGNDKTSICVTESAPFLAAFLNSSVLWWFIRQLAASKQGGFYEFKPMYVTQLPIPEVENKKPIETLVCQILATKEQDAGADVSALERQIDELVYELYGLTDEEIAIVEGK